VSKPGGIDELSPPAKWFRSGRRRYVAGIVALVAALVFTLIAVDVVNKGALTLVDADINEWLHARNSPGTTTFFLLISQLHKNLSIAIVTMAVCAYLWSKRLRSEMLTFVIAVFGGMLLNVALKLAFARARPHFEDPILTLRTFSFPSGHTMAATVFYGSLCVLVVSRVSNCSLRVAAILMAVLLISLVGFSRMYLGVHYLSDVMAGISEGVGWVALSVLLVGGIQNSS